ncbi:amidohydrolase family protein [Polaribacter vadi]|uniref:amidohydrolase family protein n=1 Tax=Polaribacter TaxID=52959 RepID=UPI001C096019|nr:MULTISPECIES: amidohydrolase family protein [Polaribacter]MBU3012330.1 amidohydrolase family protein [Polaribacter vadi]MDO6742147.1 amidohydrolase family protein [Polaribacter sp. 1_MG-2023]
MKVQFLYLFLILFLVSCKQESSKISSLIDYQGDENFSVIMSGTAVGHLKTHTVGDTIQVDYDYKNNGRGPTLKETIVLNTEGFPVQWKITGNTTFGSKVNEHFALNKNIASWTDATGSDSTSVNNALWYVDQSGSPYSAILIARSLLKSSDFSANVLPAGTLKLTEMDKISVTVDSTTVNLTNYAVSGAYLNPYYFIADNEKRLFAIISPSFVIVREGFEAQEKELRTYAENYSTQRFETLQKKYAHNYGKKVRIANVKIFDPNTLSLTEASSVLVDGERIVSIDAPNIKGKDEVIINGAGGTLVAGMYEMHAHTWDEDALLNILAGITSFRDMGNDNEVLDQLIKKINTGVLAGPRVHRLGFIEGQSEYSANMGIIVSSKEEALAALQKYHDKGFYGVKLYNSMNGDWAPAIVKKAHQYGMFVCGHVPAFSNANAMLRAGFNEMTHINQTMLGWVLEPKEDTRTLLRLTALKRFATLDLNSTKVQQTLDLFVKNKTAIDPTLTIHEILMKARDGEVWESTKDFIDHMPPNIQREYKVALADISTEKDDKEYREGYDKIVATLKIMKDKGIFIVPGTDLGGAFFYHRELELYQQLGYTPAELVKLATYDMAQYLDDEHLGSIATGKLADFFLIPGNPVEDIKAIKTISMVSRGGTFYYPSEVYPNFGIKPFTSMPEVTEE